MLPLVLVIAAGSGAAERLRDRPCNAGFKAYFVETLAAAVALVAQWRFDAVLLHGGGFAEAGVALVRPLRDAARAPILLLVDDADEELQLRALDAGAGQVLVEPTSMRVVAAQLRRLIELSHARTEPDATQVRFGPLHLDPRRATASIHGVELALTGGEFELLLLLATNDGELVHRGTIARALGRAGSAETRRSADMHVCRIRRKLRDVGGHAIEVETVYGRGYRLRIAAPDDAADEARAVAWSV